MRNSLWLAVLIMFAAFPEIARAQDPALIRHFDYDQKAPLGIKQVGIQHRTAATVYDLTYESPKGGVVPAYLVVPKARGPFAAVIWANRVFARPRNGSGPSIR